MNEGAGAASFRSVCAAANDESGAPRGPTTGTMRSCGCGLDFSRGASGDAGAFVGGEKTKSWRQFARRKERTCDRGRDGQRRVPTGREGEQAVSEKRMRGRGENEERGGIGPEPLGERERRRGPAGIVQAGGVDRAGGAVDRRAESEREDEAIEFRKFQFARHPGERSALRRAAMRDRRRRLVDQPAEERRGFIFLKEARFLRGITREVQRASEPIAEGRERAISRMTRVRRGSFAPEPADFAAETQGDIAQPIFRQRVAGSQRGQEADRRWMIEERHGAHGARLIGGL